MSNYKCVIFDVDGTLLDTSDGLISSVDYTVETFGYPELDIETKKSFIGPPIQNSFKKQFSLSDEEVKKMASLFRQRYKDVDLLKAVPYEGIYDVLYELKKNGVKIAIATYKRQDYAKILLEHFKFNEYTDLIVGSDFEGKLKKKDIIKLALQNAGIDNPGDAVMVGDSDNDAIGAKEIGSAFIGVTYGFGFKTEHDALEYDCIGCASTTEQILTYILGGDKNED